MKKNRINFYNLLQGFTPQTLNRDKFNLDDDEFEEDSYEKSSHDPFSPVYIVSQQEKKDPEPEKQEQTPFKITYNFNDDIKPDTNITKDESQTSYKPATKIDNPIKKSMEYFLNKGLTKEQASGLVGNFMSESNLKYNAINKDEKAAGLNGYGVGIAQWSNDRKNDFYKIMGTHPENSTLEQQLDFVLYEAKRRPEFFNKLKNSKSIEEATDLVLRGYENGSESGLATPELISKIYGKSYSRLGYKPYDFNNDLAKRINNAKKVLKEYENN